MKKRVFIGYTTKDLSPCWTYFNTLNLTGIIHRRWTEAIARYGKGKLSDIDQVIQVKITIEEVI